MSLLDPISQAANKIVYDIVAIFILAGLHIHHHHEDSSILFEK